MKSKSKLYYDRRSVGQSILVSGIHDQSFSFFFVTIRRQLRICWCGAPSLSRSRVRSLQFLLGVASAAVISSESHGTHEYTLLSLEGQVHVFISPRKRLPNYTLGYWVDNSCHKSEHRYGTVTQMEVNMIASSPRKPMHRREWRISEANLVPTARAICEMETVHMKELPRHIELCEQLTSIIIMGIKKGEIPKLGFMIVLVRHKTWAHSLCFLYLLLLSSPRLLH
jgi:hypothetical protein